MAIATSEESNPQRKKETGGGGGKDFMRKIEYEVET